MVAYATQLETVADIAAEEARYFTVMDAMKPYHQCPLDVQSHILTTFITTFGGFKYLRAPYGLSSIADHCNYHIAEVFEGLLGLTLTPTNFYNTEKHVKRMLILKVNYACCVHITDCGIIAYQRI